MVKLKIHGCRGSTPFDSPDNKEFGGNTSCYTLSTDDTLVILDAGTGIISAQNEFFADTSKNLALLLSHGHHDHIEGLAVTGLPFNPGSNMKIYGKEGVREDLEARLNERNFPIGLDGMPGIAKIEEVDDKFEIEGGIEVDVLQGNHPKSGVNGYRLSVDDMIVVYATDFEFSYDAQGNELDDSHKENYQRFVQGADVLIADAQFTMPEYVDEKPFCVKGWGHSYAEEVLDMAAEAGVKKVFLTHHAPTRTDDQLTGMEEHAQQYCQDKGYTVQVEYARQGKEEDI